MKAKLASVKNLANVAVVLAGLSAGSAMAALPTEATTAMTDTLADGLALIAAGWPVLAGVVGGLVMMKIFKKVIGRAT